jgi:hypothetical protein
VPRAQLTHERLGLRRNRIAPDRLGKRLTTSEIVPNFDHSNQKLRP